MNLSLWGIRHPLAAGLAFAVMCIAGLWGFRQLPISSLPGWKARAEHGIEFRHMGADEMAAIQPGLAPRFTRGTFTPGWYSIADPKLYTLALADHFRAKTSIEPPHESASSWRDNWQPTLSAILERAGGDMERAKAVIDASLEFAWGRGNNTKGRTYPVASPHSLRTISVNQAATQQTAAAAADDDTLWQRAVAAVTRRDFTDERLKAAIRAIGGTGRIASANGHDTETLKRSLGHAYRNVAAA